MTSVDEFLKQRGFEKDIHLTAEEQDPNYERELLKRGVAPTCFYTRTRVVKFIPKQKKSKPPGKFKSFMNNFKSPEVQAIERGLENRIEGKRYHTNEKGQIIETTTIRIVQLNSSRAYAADAAMGMGDGGGGGGA